MSKDLDGESPVRFVTAASLFDGHDASISIIRRTLQAAGAEVIHLGHDRSVDDVVTAAVQEDVHGVAVSSYQGGHLEYFGFLVDLLGERGAGHVRVFGGGGGVIVADEIAQLHARGVTHVFSPEEGQRLGPAGMVEQMIAACDVDLTSMPATAEALLAGEEAALARAITVLEAAHLPGAPPPATDLIAAIRSAGRPAPVLGISGTGGSGKSSLTDELVRRFRADADDKIRIAVIGVDPSRAHARGARAAASPGGALLGDRIRMNALAPGRTFFRSMATRAATGGLPPALPDAVAVCRAAGFDLVVVETPGIGQADTPLAGLADVTLYVMTPEFGAPSQLEKIGMLDLADAVAVNKVERRGGEDALRDVARQLLRARAEFDASWESMPVFGTSAARFDDDGITVLYAELRGRLGEHGLSTPTGGIARPATGEPASSRRTRQSPAIPPAREHYLGEVVGTLRDYHDRTARLADLARVRQQARATAEMLLAAGQDVAAEAAAALAVDPERDLGASLVARLDSWDRVIAQYRADEVAYPVRGRDVRAPGHRTTPSGTRLPRVGLPRADDHAHLVHYLREEHLPGHYPFTAGVFPFRRDAEAPARMFAGEGDAFRTNRRFHLLAAGQPATRLSTAFDSVTLYGRDPERRPDVYGKVGTSGVSIATLEDMKALYAGFDLCNPATSVSMTINGPAPTILAMFLTTAIDQRVDAFVAEHGRRPDDAEAHRIRARVLRTVRGTVQADILKEDQGQNTCIFSTDFALRCMADVQEWFISNDVRNFYSVSISGYHIAEAGANPITQLAFTLANAFTYVEAYLARGMSVDDFAPNFSFFFSNGMDAEYTVLGRVARRIWAVAMRERYGACERAQKLKYHVQTSGRSLHAQEMAFNDIRTTLQALCAVYDNCNSLHTNAYDEAVTTPTEESVRRALAIQLVIDQEWGLAGTENPLQGSYLVEELTDLVEAAVLTEFERIEARGGVLGAMETGYQRGRIQDESMLYERRKHDGSLPIIGVNTFLGPDGAGGTAPAHLSRGTEDERRSQLRRLADFHVGQAAAAPIALARVRQVARTGGNVFAELMSAVRVCSLGQITQALFEVGGQYRRTM